MKFGAVCCVYTPPIVCTDCSGLLSNPYILLLTATPPPNLGKVNSD